MKKLLLTLLAVILQSLAVAQSEYISNNRDMDADYLENLDGGYGLLLLSQNKSLVINVTNVKPSEFKVFRPQSDNLDGLYEYKVIIDASSTHQPKVEVGRMSDLYKTEFVANLKPD